ncbi:hypothetical protein [Chryseobacterium jejuense]|uniref:Mannosyl-glycoprotein endo-beta-N-acetylglucosaminidase n=1 Tax=Chryseobacterium jejuense TaxID=445960 RepID=A0A2X2VGE9_CHRJE|nr:hypothetical protein [Chryseobacterium jejuense]SDI83925.1 hypothetical protein SAMN05421542_1978 [Chryseobacterium jejuense]SQB27658.1 Mannosyl-glycoprotein endo-beta-N-acetylglucosaminidase [Chryseobacterium jejuense]
MGKLTIIGNDKPVIGKQQMYSVTTINGWLNPLQPIKNPLQVPKAHWEVMVQTKTGWRKGGSDKEGQMVPYIFGQKSLFHKGIKIIVRQGEDYGELIVHPQRAKEPKITRVELLDANYKSIPKDKKLSYKDTIIARAYCVEMFEMNIAFTLWEDDAQGEGHNPTVNALNKINLVPVLSRVNEKGMAEAVFRLPFYTMAVMIANARTASGDKSEGATHEYYVTADVVSKHIQKASPNINVVNPTHNPEPPRKREVPKGHTSSPPKPKTTPAPEKPKPKPDGNSAKFPVTTGGKKSDDPQGKILSAEFVDEKGNKLHSSKVGTTVKIKIVTKEMKGKKVKVKIWEEDNFTWSNDLIYEKDWVLAGDNSFVRVQLTKQLFDKAKDGGSDSSRQDYFIEVIHHDTSVTSTVMPVSADAEPTKVETGNSAVMVEKTKLKFDKVIGLGKEAILYITSEIATEITVDKNGKIASYPDYGGYNGMNEYKEGNKIYSKKLPNGKSAFPLYKMYIYRGNKIGEAVNKLKQDIENKTHENAETTVLTVARHAQTNNKDYTSYGPIPPNILKTLYRVRYMQAWNHAGKESFRYRFVDNTTSNLKPVADLKKEVSSGAMTLGNRSSISIDPWKSKDLIGCLGIRNSNGENHSSYAGEIGDLSASNYKFVYHALNNYLESIIPELTGVYGRRGYSSNGKIVVKASEYKEEIKVYALVEPLPEINNCKCNELKNDGRKEYYDSFGTKVINYVSTHTSANKFKGLYMIAQRRQENGFSLKTPLNNPMNIKGSGDAGKKSMSTHETYEGKYQARVESFANFTSEEAGFNGYIELLKKNFPDAYTALTDNSKTIENFVVGLEDTGKKGAYATGEPKNGLTGPQQYKKAVKDNFVSTLKDYKKMLECKLCKTKNEKEKIEIQKDIELLNQLK